MKIFRKVRLKHIVSAATITGILLLFGATIVTASDTYKPAINLPTNIQANPDTPIEAKYSFSPRTDVGAKTIISNYGGTPSTTVSQLKSNSQSTDLAFKAADIQKGKTAVRMTNVGYSPSGDKVDEIVTIQDFSASPSPQEPVTTPGVRIIPKGITTYGIESISFNVKYVKTNTETPVDMPGIVVWSDIDHAQSLTIEGNSRRKLDKTYIPVDDKNKNDVYETNSEDKTKFVGSIDGEDTANIAVQLAFNDINDVTYTYKPKDEDYFNFSSDSKPTDLDKWKANTGETALTMSDVKYGTSRTSTPQVTVTPNMMDQSTQKVSVDLSEIVAGASPASYYKSGRVQITLDDNATDTVLVDKDTVKLTDLYTGKEIAVDAQVSDNHIDIQLPTELLASSTFYNTRYSLTFDAKNQNKIQLSKTINIEAKWSFNDDEQSSSTIVTVPTSKVTVNAIYADENGKNIHDNNSFTGDFGSQYAIQSPDISGYILKNNSQKTITGILRQNDNIPVIYERKTTKLVISYLDEKGRTIKSDDEYSGKFGDLLQIPTPKIKYYDYKSGIPGDYHFNSSDERIFARYTPQKQKITINYIDKQGKSLAPSKTVTGSYGSSYDIRTPLLKYYKLANTNQTEIVGKYNDVSKTVNVVFEPVKTSLTVNYIDEQGKKLKAAQTYTGLYGESYKVTMPNIWYMSLANPKQHTISGIFDTLTQTINVKFKRVPAEMTFNLVDQNRKILGSTTLRSFLNTNYSFKPKLRSELASFYTLANKKSSQLKGTYSEVHGLTRVVYQAKPVKLEITYVNELNQKIKPATFRRVAYGSRYNVKQPNIQNFQSNNVTATGVIKSNVKRIVFHYHRIPTKVVLHYINAADGRSFGQKIVRGFQGQPYNVHPKLSEGFRKNFELRSKSNETIKGKFTTKYESRDIYYIGKKRQLTLVFKNDIGHQVRKTYHKSYRYGTEYTFKTPSYWYLKHADTKQIHVSGTMTSDKTIVIHYIRIRSKVLLKYYDTNGKKLAERTVWGYRNGRYRIGTQLPNSKAQFYSLGYGQPSAFLGTYQAKPTNFRVVYKPNWYQVRVRYVNENGQSVLNDTTFWGQFGQKYSFSKPTIWNLKTKGKAVVSGKITPNKVIIIKYKRIPAKYKFKYYDDRGQKVLGDRWVDGFIGDRFYVGHSNQIGYTFRDGRSPSVMQGILTAQHTTSIIWYHHVPSSMLLTYHFPGGQTDSQMINGVAGDAYYYDVPTQKYLISNRSAVSGRFETYFTRQDVYYQQYNATVFVRYVSTSGRYLGGMSYTQAAGTKMTIHAPDFSYQHYRLKSKATKHLTFGSGNAVREFKYKYHAPKVLVQTTKYSTHYKKHTYHTREPRWKRVIGHFVNKVKNFFVRIGRRIVQIVRSVKTWVAEHFKKVYKTVKHVWFEAVTTAKHVVKWVRDKVERGLSYVAAPIVQFANKVYSKVPKPIRNVISKAVKLGAKNIQNLRHAVTKRIGNTAVKFGHLVAKVSGKVFSISRQIKYSFSNAYFAAYNQMRQAVKPVANVAQSVYLKASAINTSTINSVSSFFVGVKDSLKDQTKSLIDLGANTLKATVKGADSFYQYGKTAVSAFSGNKKSQKLLEQKNKAIVSVATQVGKTIVNSIKHPIKTAKAAAKFAKNVWKATVHNVATMYNEKGLAYTLGHLTTDIGTSFIPGAGVASKIADVAKVAAEATKVSLVAKTLAAVEKTATVAVKGAKLSRAIHAKTVETVKNAVKALTKTGKLIDSIKASIKSVDRDKFIRALDKISIPSLQGLGPQLQPAGMPWVDNTRTLGDLYRQIQLKNHSGKSVVVEPNDVWWSGEHNDYHYRSDGLGRISHVSVKELHLKEHANRYRHDSKSLEKMPDDDAGHLIADWFGGSPELDNIVSQSRRVNRSELKTLEIKWAHALERGEHVEVEIKVLYSGKSMRPSEFIVKYRIGDDDWEKANLIN